MSLTSLADAPRLPTSTSAHSADAGVKHSRSRSLSFSSKDQDPIEALFQDEVSEMMLVEGILGDTKYAEEKNIVSSRNQWNIKRSPDAQSDMSSSDMLTGKSLAFPSSIQFNSQIVESTKTLESSKQNAGISPKIKDPNDILADFLASEIDADGDDLLRTKDSQRDEFKSKWKSHPTNQLEKPSLEKVNSFSPLSSKDGQTSLVFKKEEKWDEMDDLLSLLDDSRKSSNEVDHSRSGQAAIIYSDDSKEESDFGEYLPSCLSKPVHTAENKHVANLFGSLKTSDQKKEVSVKSKQEVSVSENAEEDAPLKGLHTTEVKKSQDYQSIETENVVLHALCISPSQSKVTSAQDSLETHEESKHLRDENIALKEEIMKIEAEKLRLQKDLLEKESYYEEQLLKQTSREKEEAQQIADELTSQIISLKQSLIMTEEKIELIKKAHLQEIEMLKNVHKVELEAKDQRLQSQMTLLEERRNAIETFSQLQSKADQWSSKIDQLQKNIITVREGETIEKPNWIVNIETMVAEHETFLQMLEKRSIDICNQLEKVIVTLEGTKKGLDCSQREEEQTIEAMVKNESPSFQGEFHEMHDTKLQGELETMHDMKSVERQIMLEKFLEEQKNLEAERKAVIHMKEKMAEADAALRKELLEHGLRMRMEAEDMARQKQELEQAKNIAAEIALEVEKLESYKAAFGRILPEARGRGPQHDDPFGSSNGMSVIRLLNCYDDAAAAAGMSRPPTRWDKFQSGRSELGSRMDEAFQHGPLSYEEGEQDTSYIKAQENFLVQAEKALQEMRLSPFL